MIVLLEPIPASLSLNALLDQFVDCLIPDRNEPEIHTDKPDGLEPLVTLESLSGTLPMCTVAVHGAPALKAEFDHVTRGRLAVSVRGFSLWSSSVAG